MGEKDSVWVCESAYEDELKFELVIEITTILCV